MGDAYTNGHEVPPNRLEADIFRSHADSDAEAELELLLLFSSGADNESPDSTTSLEAEGSVEQETLHDGTSTTEATLESPENEPPPQEEVESVFTKTEQTGGFGADVAKVRKSGRGIKSNGASYIDAVAMYLSDIGKVPLLTADEEKELAKKIEAAQRVQEKVDSGAKLNRSDKRVLSEGTEAKDRFIRANLRLVVSIARRYPLPQGMDLLDLVQEGNLGLEHAVDKFDWRKGFKFSTYGTFWIRQAIGRAFDQKASLIRIPGDKSARLRASLREAKGDGNQLDDRNAELHRLTTPVSLDKTVSDDGDVTLGDLMASSAQTPEDMIMSAAEIDLLNSLLDRLPDQRVRHAIELRFGLVDGERKSFREVGERFGVTAEAARRMVSRGVVRLREEAVDSDFTS